MYHDTHTHEPKTDQNNAMTNNDFVHRYMLERIYEKILSEERSRTITFENIKEADRDFGIREFNKVFREMADENFAFSKPRTDTWYLVEDDPKKYAKFLDVSEDRVEQIEINYDRKKPEPKGVVKKGNMEDHY